jgi:hypothetical protein
MAFISNDYCKDCETITQHINGVCSKCYERKEKVRIFEWNSMTVDERLIDLRKRVENLEKRGRPIF